MPLLLSILADLDLGHTVNKNEYSPMLLAQILNILIAIGGAAVGWKVLRRQPPIGEELVKLQARIDAVEKWIARVEGDNDKDLDGIQKRLREGDDLFKKEIADVSAIRATVTAMSGEVHIIKQQIASILLKLPRGK